MKTRSEINQILKGLTPGITDDILSKVLDKCEGKYDLTDMREILTELKKEIHLEKDKSTVRTALRQTVKNISDEEINKVFSDFTGKINLNNIGAITNELNKSLKRKNYDYVVKNNENNNMMPPMLTDGGIDGAEFCDYVVRLAQNQGMTTTANDVLELINSSYQSYIKTDKPLTLNPTVLNTIARILEELKPKEIVK